MATGEAGDQLQQLREAIDGLRLAVHGDSLVEARVLLDRLEAGVAEAEADYCATAGWQIDGFGTMAAFARHRYGISDAEGRRVARRAERMAAWPELLDAWVDGTLTGAQVDAAVALVPDRHVERFAATAADNVAIVAPLNLVRHPGGAAPLGRRAPTPRRTRGRRSRHRARPVPERDRDLLVLPHDRRRVDVRGLLDPDSATVVEQALRTRRDRPTSRAAPAPRPSAGPTPWSRSAGSTTTTTATGTRNRRQARLTVVADVTALYRAALRGAGVRTAASSGRSSPSDPSLGALERGLFLDAFDGKGDTARTLDGNPITDALLSCVSSGGVLERLLTAESRILDMGRTIRTFTAAQHRAAAARDQGCRRAGCDKPLHMTSLHHVEPWEAGGATDIANAVHQVRPRPPRRPRQGPHRRARTRRHLHRHHRHRRTTHHPTPRLGTTRATAPTRTSTTTARTRPRAPLHPRSTPRSPTPLRPHRAPLTRPATPHDQPRTARPRLDARRRLTAVRRAVRRRAPGSPRPPCATSPRGCGRARRAGGRGPRAAPTSSARRASTASDRATTQSLVGHDVEPSARHPPAPRPHRTPCPGPKLRSRMVRSTPSTWSTRSMRTVALPETSRHRRSAGSPSRRISSPAS